MITEADRRDENRPADPHKGKSKRERRRDERRRIGERQCEGCRHQRMDHTPIRNERATFCHVCMDPCTPK